MRGEYAKILRSIGTRFRQMLMSIGEEPLPQRFTDLLRRLAQREPKNMARSIKEDETFPEPKV